MQLYKMFSIRDSKAAAYHPPFYKKSHGEAERDFSDLASDTQTAVGKHPEDYDLYYVGQYNDETGQVLPLDTPQHIAKAIDRINRQ